MSNMYSPDVTSDDKLWTALSYVFSPLVPIILMLLEDKKNRPYIKYHAIQSLAAGIVLILLSIIISTVTFGLGALCIGPLYLIIVIYWAYKAYQGEMFEIPVLTNLLKGQGWI